MATYEIVIKNESTTSKSSPVAGDNENGGSVPAKNQSTENLVKSLVAYKKVVPYVKQAIQHEISTVELRTGSAELQQRIEFGYHLASSGFSIAESIGVGIAIGKGAGAVAGAVIGIVGELLNISYRADTINLKRSEESISLGIMDRRAGGLPATYNKSRGGSQ